MQPYDTQTMDTPAGVYTIELHADDDPENPLTSWDQTGLAFWVNYRSTRYIEVNTLDDADEAAANVLHTWVEAGHDQEEVARRYDKWRAITSSSWLLVPGADSSSQSDYYRWYVLANSAVLTEPYEAVTAAMENYRTWAAGEVCGFIVKAPNGQEVDACWGFYSDETALAEARFTVASDVRKRLDASNLVGAGFVGLI